jgi:hypothetical protein
MGVHRFAALPFFTTTDRIPLSLSVEKEQDQGTHN